MSAPGGTAQIQARSNARKRWKQTLEAHGCVPHNRYQPLLPQVYAKILRLHQQQDEEGTSYAVDAYELAVAAAGRLQSTETANRSREVRCVAPGDAEQRRKGRPSHHKVLHEVQATGLDKEEQMNAEAITGIPGVKGMQCLQLAHRILHEADTYTSRCAECNAAESTNRLREDEEHGGFFCAACWEKYERECLVEYVTQEHGGELLPLAQEFVSGIRPAKRARAAPTPTPPDSPSAAPPPARPLPVPPVLITPEECEVIIPEEYFLSPCSLLATPAPLLSPRWILGLLQSPALRTCCTPQPGHAPQLIAAGPATIAAETDSDDDWDVVDAQSGDEDDDDEVWCVHCEVWTCQRCHRGRSES